MPLEAHLNSQFVVAAQANASRSIQLQFNMILWSLGQCGQFHNRRLYQHKPKPAPSHNPGLNERSRSCY